MNAIRQAASFIHQSGSLLHPQRLPIDWSTRLNASAIPSEIELHRTKWDTRDPAESLDEFMVDIDTAALTYAAAHSIKSSALPHIREFAFGGWNKLFSLTFPDSTEMIARIPMRYCRLPNKVESEAATMIFARDYCNIPAPKIFAWNSSDRNPVRAPYILMSKTEGVEPWEIWGKLSEDSRLRLLDTLARHHARFARPLPFDRIGSLYFANSTVDASLVDFRDLKNYRIGGYAHSPSCIKNRGRLSHPESVPKFLREFWREHWQCELDMVIKRWGSARDTVIEDEEEENHTLGELLDAAADIRTAIDQVKLPDDSRWLAPSLVMSDYAFRNIIIDPTTLEVTGFLDWEDVHVMPFVLGTRLPEDIRTSSRFSPDLDATPKEEEELPGLESEEYPLCMERLRNQAYSNYYARRLAVYDGRFDGDSWKVGERLRTLEYLVSHGWRCWIGEGLQAKLSRLG